MITPKHTASGAPRRAAPRTCRRTVGILAVVLAGAGAHVEASPPFDTGPVPETPGSTVAAPMPPTPEHQHAVQLPENWQELARELTLADIIDIALGNNQETRASWFAARSAAADVGSKKGELLPSVDLEATISRVKVSAVGGLFSFQQTTGEPSVSVRYLLFDFGGRSARIGEAEAALAAADWQHNATIQNVILAVQQAYLSYLNAKAQLEAADATVKEAQTNLDAAQRRREVGVATIADVLQAKTVLSRSILNRQTIAGRIQTLRGSLATAMGIPASTPFDVGTLPEALPVEKVETEVAPLIERAVSQRPDLAAARWRAEKAAVHVGTIKAEGRPSVGLAASANRTYYLSTPGNDYADNWSASVNLTFPLFTGFTHTYDVRKAEADAEVSRSQAASAEQQVILDVWTAQAALETARQQVATTKDLLASATQSADVARGRYKEGVGSILDLLTAQAALAGARAQEIQARSDWLLAVAQLAHAIGGLSPRDPTPGLQEMTHAD